MRSPIVLGAFLALLTPAGVLAQRADLPPVEKVAEALDNHPSVAAARARVDAARSDRDMLAKGSHEIRSEEQTSEIQSLIRIPYVVFSLNKQITIKKQSN